MRVRCIRTDCSSGPRRWRRRIEPPSSRRRCRARISTARSSPSIRSPASSFRSKSIESSAARAQRRANDPGGNEPEADDDERGRAECPRCDEGGDPESDRAGAPPSHTGTGVPSSASRTTSSGPRPADRASGASRSRWRARASAISRMSSGVTNVRRSTSARAFASRRSAMPGARARAEGKVPVAPCVPQERHHVAVDALLDEDVARRGDGVDELLTARDGHEAIERRLTGLLGEHARLVGERRVADRHLHREAVELGLGQRVGALVLDGILGRDHEEGPIELIALAVDRDLRLLHRLEQCGLRLRRGTVDLVDEQHVGEDRDRAGSGSVLPAGRRRSLPSHPRAAGRG